MSARDDYPLTARLGRATPGNRQREAAAVLDEIDLLRASLAATQEALRLANGLDELRGAADQWGVA